MPRTLFLIGLASLLACDAAEFTANAPEPPPRLVLSAPLEEAVLSCRERAGESSCQLQRRVLGPAESPVRAVMLPEPSQDSQAERTRVLEQILARPDLSDPADDLWAGSPTGSGKPG